MNKDIDAKPPCELAAADVSALGSPEEVRQAAKVLRKLIRAMQKQRDTEHWWQHLLGDYPIEDLRWTAQRLEESADELEAQGGKPKP
jgi:hypothetical protein